MARKRERRRPSINHLELQRQLPDPSFKAVPLHACHPAVPSAGARRRDSRHQLRSRVVHELVAHRGSPPRTARTFRHFESPAALPTFGGRFSSSWRSAPWRSSTSQLRRRRPPRLRRARQHRPSLRPPRLPLLPLLRRKRRRLLRAWRRTPLRGLQRSCRPGPPHLHLLPPPRRPWPPRQRQEPPNRPRVAHPRPRLLRLPRPR
jgi:hypothetical protein